MGKHSYFIIIFVLFLFTSCGYKFTGSGDFPKGVNSIFMPIFENKTSETGVETTLTNELIIQIVKKGKVKVKDKKGDADATIYGVVVTLKDNAVSSDETLTQSESKLTLYANIKLKKSDGTILLNLAGVNSSKNYTTYSSDKQTTLSNKATAIEELSQNLAETIYNRLTDDF